MSTTSMMPHVMSLDSDVLSAEAALSAFEYERSQGGGTGHAVYFTEEWGNRLLVTLRRLARLCEQTDILPPPAVWNALYGDDTGPGGKDRNNWDIDV